MFCSKVPVQQTTVISLFCEGAADVRVAAILLCHLQWWSTFGNVSR